MELDASAEDSNRTKLKRITMMIDKEDESMGFLQRGTVYDQQTRRSVYMAGNPGYETRERISFQRDEVEGYDTFGKPVVNHPERRSGSVARGVTRGYDVPRIHYPQEQYGGSVHAYDNNVRRTHHRSRHADDVGRQQAQYNDTDVYTNVYLDMSGAQMGRTQGHSDVRINPQNIPNTDRIRRRLPRLDEDGNQVQISDDYHTYYNRQAESSLDVDGYMSFSDDRSDAYGDTEDIQRATTPEYVYGDFRRSLPDTPPREDSRRSHRRRHTENMGRRGEPTGPPEVGDGNVASDDEYDTLP